MSRETLRNMLIAAGEEATCKAFRKAYETVRRPVIMGTNMPVPRSVQNQLWAATEALKEMNLHTRRWEMGRSVDYKLILERDRRT